MIRAWRMIRLSSRSSRQSCSATARACTRWARGRFTRARIWSEVVSALHLDPDFDYVKHNGDSDFEFVHRKLKDGDIYFVDNRSDHDESIDATFRVAGMRPELWRAETANDGTGLVRHCGRSNHRATAS